MRATTKIKTRLTRVEETVAETTRLFINSGATIEKILVNKDKWHGTFGTYDPKAGKLVATRRMQVNGIQVEFSDVNDTEIVLSVDCEPVSTKAAKK